MVKNGAKMPRFLYFLHQNRLFFTPFLTVFFFSHSRFTDFSTTFWVADTTLDGVFPPNDIP